MKKIFSTFAFLLFVSGAAAQTFTLKSNDLGGQATPKQVFNSLGCTGQNRSPQLSWVNAPPGTESFAVTLFDESAPTGSGWWHWLIFDIPANITELKAGAGNINLKLAPTHCIQSLNDFRIPGYGGPCPPKGGNHHKYIITVFALKTEKLGLDAQANPALVGYMLEQQVIQKASIVFYYKR